MFGSNFKSDEKFKQMSIYYLKTETPKVSFNL